MSQWLTSGRNRLIEKQQQKQQFGNQQSAASDAVTRDSQRGAVSTGVILPNNNITLEGLQAHLSNQEILDEKARMSLLLEEQKVRPVYEELLRMQQNGSGALGGQRMNFIDSSFPLMSSSGSNTLHDTNSVAPLISRAMANEGISHLNAANMLSNPFFEIELQQEYRNIAALQEEVQRQLRQKQVVEELQIIDQLTTQQALIIEMEKQKHQQRVTTEQLLSQFAGIEQLAARQEMLNRFSNQLPSNFADLSSVLSLEDPRLLNLALQYRNQPASALTTGVQLPSLPGSDMNVLTNNLEIQNALINQASLLEKVSQVESHTSSSTSNVVPQMVPSVTIDKKNLPKIRYFNCGSEIQENGESIASKEKPKKKKLVFSKEAKDPTRQKQKKISTKKAVVVKTAKTTMVKKGKKGITDKTATRGVRHGPHHDLMIELFDKKKKNDAKNDEAKLDAATALLGFKTLP